MAIHSIPTPVVRELTPATAVPQSSLTGRERDLQMQEGEPAIEVAQTAQDAVRWQRREPPPEKVRRRSRGDALEPMTHADAGQAVDADADEPGLAEPGPPAEIADEEETGTLFDSRS